MHSLSAFNLVQVWEWGQHRHPVDRAIALLTLAQPELDSERIASLSVGQRNTRLLLLREQLLGPTLNGYAECTQCHEKLEFTVEAGSLRLPEPQEMEFELSDQDFMLHCRLPTSRDLAAIIGYRDLDAARQLLINQCVIQAYKREQPIANDRLPESLIPTLANAVMTRDPQTEMRFELQCPACGLEWSALFDIVNFFWTELNDWVKRLLYDVHLLAQAYGWSEADILSMDVTRRQYYLDWINGN